MIQTRRGLETMGIVVVEEEKVLFRAPSSLLTMGIVVEDGLKI